MDTSKQKNSLESQVLSNASAVAVANGCSTPISMRLAAGLASLLEAHTYVQDLKTDPWDFAVDLPSLRSLGLSKSDFRWLAAKGLVQCGLELTLDGDERRSFQHLPQMKFSKRTCLVLTEAGIAVARTVVRSADASRAADGAPSASQSDPSVAAMPGAPSAELPLPVWDRNRQQLRLGKLIVKQFKLPAANQETVLAVFEEEGWPPRIDDPLPARPDQDPRRRLHDTINSLNRNQKRPLLRFLGDGSGQGVRWEYASHRDETGDGNL